MLSWLQGEMARKHFALSWQCCWEVVEPLESAWLRWVTGGRPMKVTVGCYFQSCDLHPISGDVKTHCCVFALAASSHHDETDGG